MRDAMQAGAHYVGGLDPTNVDGAMEKSLDLMFQIALDYDKGVDIHLHETSPAGVAAVNYMVETVEKTPELKGKLTISHAFALATLNEQEVDAIATRMAAQQVTIASTVPIGTLHMPLKQLRDKGVFVMTGTDSVIDHWSPYGPEICWKKPIFTRSCTFARTSRRFPGRSVSRPVTFCR